MPSEQGPASSCHSGPVPGESASFTCLYPLTGNSQVLVLCSSCPLENLLRHLGRSEIMRPILGSSACGGGFLFSGSQTCTMAVLDSSPHYRICVWVSRWNLGICVIAGDSGCQALWANPAATTGS